MSTLNPSRLPAGFFEADDEGYMQTPEEPAEDGLARGIEFALYIQYPEVTTKTFEGVSDQYGMHNLDFQFTDDEAQMFVPWIQEQHPEINFCFDADEHCDASVYDDYRPGEDDEALMMRLTVNNNEYNKLRNRWTIFWHGLEDFIEYIKAHRAEEEAA